MKISHNFKKLVIGSSVAQIKRTENGVMQIQGDDPVTINKAIGYVHAYERLTQMLLTRVVAKGKITQHLFDNDSLFAMDALMRKMAIEHDIIADLENLSDEAKTWCSAYCEGVNHYIETRGVPLLCKVLNVPSVPWSIQDIFTLIKAHMYVGLAQAQERLERFILQAIHDGVPIEQLKKLFYPHLEKIDEETIGFIKKLHMERPYLKNMQMHFEPAFSNNWVVSGKKSHSGKPLCACDPHLQVNRLPSFWYEVLVQTETDFQMGITLPGFPGIVMGRSNNLFASFTYGMMDTVDFFIEEIKDQKYRREDGWKSLTLREEVVERKKKGKVTLKFFETDAGVIERKGITQGTLEDGLYLSLGWSCAHGGVSAMVNAFAKLWQADSVFKAGEVVREMTLPCNWVFADSENNIAFQQSGRLPKRRHDSLFPLLAWKKENLWDGFVPGEQLSSSYNPPQGFIASANDDKNQLGLPISITSPYAPYRYDRIVEYLEQDKEFTVKEMQDLQCDVYSKQAERFMDQIRDVIPHTPAGEILRNWDCRYNKESKGATLFEAYYAALFQEVFGRVFGHAVWNEVATRRSLLIFTHGHFDRVVLSDDESWFGTDGKKAFLKKVIEEALHPFSRQIPRWGKKNSFMMSHLLFDGRLGRLLRFNIGPVEIGGNKATVAASFVFREKKKQLAAGATYRMVTDLASQEAFTVLAGGPSERRRSRYYVSDLKKWLKGQYKKIKI